MLYGTACVYEEPRTKKHGGWGFKVFYQEAYPGTVSANAHTHDILEIIWINKGSFYVSVNGMEHYLKEDDIILFCSKEIHSIRAGEDEKNGYWVIKIDPSILYRCSPEGSNTCRYILPFVCHQPGKKRCFSGQESEKAGIRRHIVSVVNEYKSRNYASELAISGECVSLLAAFLKLWHEADIPEKDTDMASVEAVYKALGYIHENFCEHISAEDCCRRVGLSYSYFSRTFKKITGKGFSEYVNYLRCARAENLLLTTSKTVSGIAGECGFSDTGYFIQRFKKERGMTPNSLRRKSSGSI